MSEEYSSRDPDKHEKNHYTTEEHSSQKFNRHHKPQMSPLLLVVMIIVIAGLAAGGYMLSHGIIFPGQDSELLKRIQDGLRFHLVRDQAISATQLEPINPETDFVIFEAHANNRSGMYYKLDKTPAILGTNIKEAWLDKDEIGGKIIKISFDSAGSGQFADFTGKHIGEQLAIVYGDNVISAPVIQSRIAGGQAQITGRNIEVIFEEIRNAEDKMATEATQPEKE
ncbi:MAG: hypothetical protein KKB51_15955 [Candidatus Riflebacteria bacterium]|nr:hypothetical protein [Candidatus Riflebacteria bacterium]